MSSDVIHQSYIEIDEGDWKSGHREFVYIELLDGELIIFWGAAGYDMLGTWKSKEIILFQRPTEELI